MSRGALVVYREYLGCFEEAGHLAPSDEGVVFAYSESYLQNETAHAISQALPLQVEAFSPSETESFFEGILPEGRMRRNQLVRWYSKKREKSLMKIVDIFL